MKKDQLFKRYRSRLVKEGIVKSVLYGLMIGAAVDFVTALVCWIFKYNGILPAIGAGLIGWAIGGVLLYFLRFRPTEKTLMRRVDQVGLEERAITMMEFANDESVMAKLQREDTRARVGAVEDEKLKQSMPLFSVKPGGIVAIAATFLFGAGMTVVVALTAAGVIESPGIVDALEPHETFVNVSYLVEGGGDIDGEPEQLVLRESNADPVVAVAEDGWVFVGWSDGVKTLDREDHKLIEDFEVTAIFEEIEDGDGSGDGDKDSNGGDGEEGDGDSDDATPSDSEGENANGNQQDGDGEHTDMDGDENGGGKEEGSGKGESNSNQDSDGKGNGTAGGWSGEDRVIDGMTDYHSVYEYYYDMAMEMLTNGEELPPELKEFVEQYYNSL